MSYSQFNGYSVLIEVEEGLALLVTEDLEGVVESELVEDPEETEESS